jgi:hypothetical protein
MITLSWLHLVGLLALCVFTGSVATLLWLALTLRSLDDGHEDE